MAGAKVQTHSTIWASSKFLSTNELVSIDAVITPTYVIINTSTKLIKSCNITISSIIGELASWSPS